MHCLYFICERKFYARKKITRHWKSTVSLVEDWKSAVDRKELAYFLANDMSKAFDSLCHSLIVKKLEAYGFEPREDKGDREGIPHTHPIP